jgi:hypothetical protein
MTTLPPLRTVTMVVACMLSSFDMSLAPMPRYPDKAIGALRVI